MRVLGILFSMAAGVFLIGTGSAQEKKAPTNKEKIIGVWEFVKGIGTTPNGKATFEFTKDGKMKVTLDGKPDPGEEYQVDGDNLKIRYGKEFIPMWTIKTLTDKELVVENAPGEKKAKLEFKRAK